MIETTMAIIKSTSSEHIQIEHNNREYDENGHPYFSKNVDKSLSNENWYFQGNTDIREFYRKTFQDEYERQNERTRKTNPERLQGKKENYYDEVLSKQLKRENDEKALKEKGLKKHDLNKKLPAAEKVAHEMIIQLGDRSGLFGTLTGTKENKETAKKILREFFDTWQKKYPQMKIVNGALHCDEIGRDKKGGTIHLHITFVPVCENYKSGMRVRNSMTGALKEMGFENDKTKSENGFHFAVEKWEKSLYDDLEKIALKYDIKRSVLVSAKREHLDIKTYGQLRDRETFLDMRENNIAHREIETDRKENKLQIKETALNDFIEHKANGFNEAYENTHFRQRDNRFRSEINQYWKIYQNNSNNYWSAYRTKKDNIYNLLNDRNRDLNEVAKQLNNELSNLSLMNGGILSFLFRVVYSLILFFDKKELEKEVAQLQKLNIEINKTRKLVSQYQDETKTVLKNEDIAQIKKSLEVWENKLQETEKELGYEIMTNDEITVIDTETIEKEHFNNVADDILR